MQWLLCVLTWIRGRPNATVMVVNVTMKRKGASSVHKMLKPMIRRRILRTDDGGKPNCLAASRALLVPEAASDAIASISTAMQGARASFKHGSFNKLYERPAGVKEPFPLFTVFLNSEFTQGNGR
ncbi:hypothetical protein TNCV_1707891 [Trichonephila clavipes]|nr:hypothetical protein TNCV_1707891 [Trichonephila clavipes]